MKKAKHFISLYLIIALLMNFTQYIVRSLIDIVYPVTLLMDYIILILVGVIYTFIFCKYRINFNMTIKGKVIFSFNNRQYSGGSNHE